MTHCQPMCICPMTSQNFRKLNFLKVANQEFLFLFRWGVNLPASGWRYATGTRRGRSRNIFLIGNNSCFETLYPPLSHPKMLIHLVIHLRKPWKCLLDLVPNSGEGQEYCYNVDEIIKWHIYLHFGTFWALIC